MMLLNNDSIFNVNNMGTMAEKVIIVITIKKHRINKLPGAIVQFCSA